MPMPSSIVRDCAPNSNTYIPSARATYKEPQAQALRDFLNVLRTFVGYNLTCIEGPSYVREGVFFSIKGDMDGVTAVNRHCREFLDVSE